MYKKIFLFLLVISPLLFTVFIGIPIIDEKSFEAKSEANPSVTVSRRCYAVEDFGKFTACMKTNQKVSGLQYWKVVSKNISQHSPFFFIVITVAFLMQLTCVVVTIFRRNGKKKT